MCLPDLMFMELQVKEHKAALEKEAEQIRMLRSAGKEHGKIKRYCIEKFADLLISIGEFLKKKYCPGSPVCFGIRTTL
ncbi:MAG: hypothetical protein A2277_19205 [Desulfobacterales bacterium RIFOXYA12_FULL_46_15]|nr:MAG: hypothetical protein A2277_19205 [Desulfobacterales bacterium RIFOXYA12_FULL_46_15]